jgi:uncharacterized membrane protein
MKQYKYTWQSLLPYILLGAGLIGGIASFALTYDKVRVLQNPHYQPGCNLNPVLSCGSVMKTAQASLFGVPNTVFGLIAFSMLGMFALALLAGASFKRWLWQCAQVAATVGVVCMHYLFFQAVFRIHAICPWCFVVWMITIPVFLAITIHNSRAGNVHLPAIGDAAAFISKYSLDVLLFWYLVIFVTLLVKFWYYWSTLIR